MPTTTTTTVSSKQISALESPPRGRDSNGPLVAYDPERYIKGYSQLCELEVGFYPVRSNKSPAVEGKLDRIATVEPKKIVSWAERDHHRSFAVRIRKRSRLLVIDTEDPSKKLDRFGPDGELVLADVLEEHNITLPLCPIVSTPSGGWHRYMLLPKGLRIRHKSNCWPGVDILAEGSNVVLPGSRTDRGEYVAVRSFEDYPLPEAPKAFIKLIRKVQNAKNKHSDKSCGSPRLATGSGQPSDLDTHQVSRREWCRLCRNRYFYLFWKRKPKLGDSTDSAYQFQLAKICFCNGLNKMQVEAVLLSWRHLHGLKGSVRKLRRSIIPKAWKVVAPWIESWQSKREAAKKKRRSIKTRNRILALLANGGQQTPASTARALHIPRERVKKAMQRMVRQGDLLRTPGGYQITKAVGTF